jgi:hypothetical protein
MDAIEAVGVPVVMVRGNGRADPDEGQDVELLIPVVSEAAVLERFAGRRTELQAEADAWRGARAADAG